MKLKTLLFLSILSVSLLFVLQIPITEASGEEWVSPTGFEDPENEWSDETNAYDGNTGTYASLSTDGATWRGFLVLTIESIESNKLRFWIDCDCGMLVDIDVYWKGEWKDVFEDLLLPIDVNQWIEKSFSGGTVTKMRIRFGYGEFEYARVHEVEFWKLIPPTIGEFQAPSTVYANQYFFLNATIDDPDGVTDFIGAVIGIDGTVILKWENSTNIFSEYSDPSGYCTLDADNSERNTVNSTAYKISWKIKLTWTYSEGYISVISANTRVYDSTGASSSGSYSNLFTFEDDTIVHSDAAVDDSCINPSESITFTGTIYYQGTSTVPEDVTGVIVYVELSGTEKGNDNSITGGQFSINFNGESTVGQYSYNIYALTDQTSETNRTVTVTVEKVNITITIGDHVIDINTNASISVSGVYQYSGVTYDGSFTLNYTTYNHPTAQRQGYTVSSISGDTYGITTIGVNDEEYVIWESVTISITGPTDKIIDINTNASGLIVTGTYDCRGTAYDGSFTLNYTTYQHATAQRQGYTVSSISGDTDGITIISTNDETYCIWESITITITGPTDNRIDISTNASGIMVSGTYDYHATSYDGSLTLNDTTYNYATSGRRDYTVASASGDSYGITAISTNDNTYCIWDRGVVTISANTTSPVPYAYADFTVTAIYDYDKTPITDWTVNILKDSVHFATGNFTDGGYIDVYHVYTTENITETQHGLTAFTSNTETVYWSTYVALTIKTIDLDNDILTQAIVYFNETALEVDQNGLATKYYIIKYDIISVKVKWSDMWVNGSWTVNMTTTKTIEAECNVWSLTINAKDTDGTMLSLSPTNFIWTFPNTTEVNHTRVDGSWSFKIMNGTHYYKIQYQGQWVSENITLPITDKNVTSVTKNCWAYSLTVYVQTSSDSPDPNKPITGVDLTLKRDGTTLNGLYGLSSEPKTSAYNSTHARYIWTQLANQTDSYIIWADITGSVGAKSITTALTSDTEKVIQLVYPASGPSPPIGPTFPTPSPIIPIPEIPPIKPIVAFPEIPIYPLLLFAGVSLIFVIPMLKFGRASRRKKKFKRKKKEKGRKFGRR